MVSWQVAEYFSLLNQLSLLDLEDPSSAKAISRKSISQVTSQFPHVAVDKLDRTSVGELAERLFPSEDEDEPLQGFGRG